MKSHRISLAAVPFLFFLALTATTPAVQAAPLTLTLTGGSEISYYNAVDLDTGFVYVGIADVSALTGTLSVEIERSSPGTPTGLKFNSATVAATETLETTISLGAFGSIDTTVSDLKVGLSTGGGPTPSVTANSFSLADHDISLSDAMVMVEPNGPLPTTLLINPPIDFPENSQSHLILPTTNFGGAGTITETPTGNPNEYLVSVTIPLEDTSTVSVPTAGSASLARYLDGQIVATGIYVVPEPAAAVLALLAIGMCGLWRIAGRRREG